MLKISDLMIINIITKYNIEKYKYNKKKINKNRIEFTYI